MADRSKIEWTDATWNPIRARNRATGKVGWHCEHMSEGCRGCYAETMNRRLGTGLSFKPSHRKDIELFLDEQMLMQPLRWKRARRIFVCSMTDLFADFVPDEWIDRVFAVMELCPQHTFQVLTKRPGRAKCYIRDCAGRDWEPLPNVWLGTSCEDQAAADERIPHLLATPAAVRFVSLEPLLGPVDLFGTLGPHSGSTRYPRLGGLDLVIVGGESGPGARPMHPDWASSLRDQCQAAGLPFFFKQWGEWAPWDDDNWSLPAGVDDVEAADRARRIDGVDFLRVGKKRAGRLLDGRTWDGMP